MNKQQAEQNIAVDGQWFMICALHLLINGIAPLFAGLVVLILKGRRKTYEMTT